MMNSKHTLIWAAVAVGLFAFIFFFERHRHEPPAGPARILPHLSAAAVQTVQVRPAGKLEIRAERTTDGWRLTEPLVYPAQEVSIESLLAVLEHLTPAAYLTLQELRNNPRAGEEFGFESPQASLLILQSGYRHHILVGAKTAPGDQVFLQVVGDEGVYVVDADLLKLIPREANEWRDTAFLNLEPIVFDRLLVTNVSKVLELQRDPDTRRWRMIRPNQARADSEKINLAVKLLQHLRVEQFVSDDPRADLEPLGLQPAELDIAFARGTNTALLVQFGRSPTNQPGSVYARRSDLDAIVTVPRELPSLWRASHEVFRDRHLVAITAPLDAIEVRGRDQFTLQRQTNNTWRVLPAGFTADNALVSELIANLSGMQIAQFEKDVVTEPDLPRYGLAEPARQFFLHCSSNAPASTNTLLAQIDFGVVPENKVFARRSDESFVYAIHPADFERLPSASWQLRERRIWSFTENDVSRLTIQQNGKTRQLIRNGTNSWSFAPGSQGIINDFAVEESVHRLTDLSAVAWTERGEQNRDRFGFTADGHRIALELKNGGKLKVEFGGEAPSQLPYAAVALDGETWIFECPLPVYQYVLTYLTIPANIP